MLLLPPPPDKECSTCDCDHAERDPNADARRCACAEATRSFSRD
jgi:hypothetical protein